MQENQTSVCHPCFLILLEKTVVDDCVEYLLELLGYYYLLEYLCESESLAVVLELVLQEQGL